MNCLFCSIVNKEKSSFIIYEDETVLSFLDIFPRTLAHTVVIPKRHMETVLEMKPEEMQLFWMGVNKTLKILQEKINPNGFTIGINHGKVSGQAVEHLHIHLMPRFEGDGGGSMHSVINNPSQKTPAQVYAIITNTKNEL